MAWGVHDLVDVRAEKVVLVAEGLPADERQACLLRLVDADDVVRQRHVAKIHVEARRLPPQRWT